MNRQKPTTKRSTPAKKGKAPSKHSLQGDPKRLAAKRTVRRARPIHKRILLHPITIVLLLCIGIFIACWTYRAAADSYSLTAEVHAPPLGEGAVITSPTNGEVFTQSPITVMGSCPTGSYVNLSRNGTFSGVAFCSSDNTFQIQTDLFSEENVLVAQDYNTTNDPGPTTPSVTVTYNPPAAPSSSSSSSSGSSSTASRVPSSGAATTSPAPLLLTSSFEYQTFVVNTPFTWRVQVEGGVAPYKITTGWGDSESSSQTVTGGPTFSISHVYDKQGYYVIVVQVTDAAGNTAMLQLAALVKNPGSSKVIFSGGGSVSTPTNPSLWQYLTGPNGWLWFAWPSFIVVLLIILSFWLGERQEYQDLLKQQRLLPRGSHR